MEKARASAQRFLYPELGYGFGVDGGEGIEAT
jgi:hypothetical protein